MLSDASQNEEVVQNIPIVNEIVNIRQIQIQNDQNLREGLQGKEIDEDISKLQIGPLCILPLLISRIYKYFRI